MNTIESEPLEKKKSSVWSWIRFFLLLGMIFFLFRYAIGITVVNGNSMHPTLEHQDAVLSSSIFYTPEKGDIILFRHEAGFDVIKRIIGEPGDTIEIKDSVVYVNEEPIQEEYTIGTSGDMSPVEVDEGYFVMGDNRTPGESLDSRSDEMGLITKERIKGEVMFSLWPIGSIR